MHSGIDPAHMDTSVRPQDDLFAFVNGAWLATAEIPPDRGRYGAFDMLREASEAAMHELIEESAAAAADAEPGSPERKVGDLFHSFMDTGRIAELGLAPLGEELRRIAGVASAADV